MLLVAGRAQAAKGHGGGDQGKNSSEANRKPEG